MTQAGIPNWPIDGSGLNARVVRRLTNAGIARVGQLAEQTPRLGRAGQRNLQWFLDWTRRIECDESLVTDLRSWLTEFLTPAQVFVVEQRYGLTDLLFRPQMKRQTLQEIAEARGGQTRERIRQVLNRSFGKLHTCLAQATLQPVTRECVARIEAAGKIVTSAELTTWRGAAWLGGYQPWGALLLLNEVTAEICRRCDYFTTLPSEQLDAFEIRLLEALEKTTAPVRVENIASDMALRLASVILDRHPLVDATRDGRFFLFRDGARELLSGLAGDFQRYNELVAPHSRRDALELAACLRRMRR